MDALTHTLILLLTLMAGIVLGRSIMWRELVDAVLEDDDA